MQPGQQQATSGQLYEAVNAQLEATLRLLGRLKVLWAATDQRTPFPEASSDLGGNLGGSPGSLGGYATPASSISSRWGARKASVQGGQLGLTVWL